MRQPLSMFQSIDIHDLAEAQALAAQDDATILSALAAAQ